MKFPSFFSFVLRLALLVSFLYVIWNNSAEASLSNELSLSQAVGEAMQGSLVVQKSHSVREEASWKRVETYSGFLPTLTGTASYLTDKRYMLLDANLGSGAITIPQVVPTTIYGVQASWPLFDGFASTRRWEAGISLESAAESEYTWTRFTIERQTILQYYQVIAAKTLREVSEQNLTTLKDHLKDVAALKRAGVSTNYDLLRVEVQISEAESEVLSDTDNFEMSRLHLAELLGKDKEDRLPTGTLPRLKPDILKGIQDADTMERRDLIGLKERVQSLEFMDKSASAYWVPKISLVGQYQRYNNINDRFSDSDAFRDAYQVGVNLNWNLFDGMLSPARSAQAAQQALQIQKTYQQTKLKALQDLEFWKRKYAYFLAVAAARAGDIERSAEAVRLAKAGRRAGTRTTTDLLDAELDLFRSKAGLVKAQMGSIEALVHLELASGKKLYTFY
ncbi:MAG: TolC family protein [Bdellovibrio sp. CG10_big_fil_rev_8_21_14_0_10_47_8]|nr:MAG: TolC family protein [Bdellovibrio sp. CG10_big_fil_rev_8_21_14_0_10_47_8]